MGQLSILTLGRGYQVRGGRKVPLLLRGLGDEEAKRGLCLLTFVLLPPLGTQRVISFLRQVVEHGGFYRTTDQTWITLERIQFVGACNPPTDPGRKPLSHRYVCFGSVLSRTHHYHDCKSCFNQRKTRGSGGDHSSILKWEVRWLVRVEHWLQGIHGTTHSPHGRGLP